jgi:lysyl-tRNA synthetase class 2
MSIYHLSTKKHIQENLYVLLSAIRQYFAEQKFLEVQVPPIVSNPGMEAHLHPFKVTGVQDKNLNNLYLHTSPEFFMKKLLSEGLEKIFNISYSFRHEPRSETHRPQFLMLEWYRKGETYEAIESDCDHMIKSCFQAFEKDVPTKQYVTVNELFENTLSFSILDFLDTNHLEEKILKDYPQLLSHKPVTPWPWEDYFFLLFLNLIEPEFKNIPYLMVDLFPSPLAALSTLNPNDPRTCQRFEIYLNGIELANCFNELTNLNEQRHRMSKEAKKKKELYGYELPEPSILYNALEKGIGTPSSGIALGIERLLYAITNEDSFTS